MSSIATLNGVQYIVPAYNDTGWAQGAGNLSLYLAAIAANTLQPTGGAFTLTADVDFGANFGIKALFLKSETANPASAGNVRLAKTDSIKWRNNANGADIALAIDGTDNLTYATTKVLLSGAVVNADINASAAIAYSKLALTGAILNADLAGSIAYSKLSLTGAILNADLAGSIAYSKLSLTGAILNADLAGSIAYSKLTLTGSVVNADIGAAAAIALTKLAALGNNFAVATNGSGVLVASAVTATELGYVSGVTSAIQTQINAITVISGTYTPTITGFGSPSPNVGFYQRIGNMVHVWGSFKTGTSTGVSAKITLPVGSLVYTNRLPTDGSCFLGWCQLMFGSRAVDSADLALVFADGSDTAAVYLTATAPATGTASWVKATGSSFADNCYISYDFWYATA